MQCSGLKICSGVRYVMPMRWTVFGSASYLTHDEGTGSAYQLFESKLFGPHPKACILGAWGSRRSAFSHFHKSTGCLVGLGTRVKIGFLIQSKFVHRV